MYKFLAAVDLEHQISAISIRAVLIASVILAVCTLVSLLIKNKKKLMKKWSKTLFLLMSGSLVITTVVLFGGTIYLNNTSESKGPVHWHTGIEFWSCGAELELRNPTGFLSNKIGTSTYHEHNDKFIHLEGVVVRKSEDASLEKFMQVTGGYLTEDSIGIPLNDDEAQWYALSENDKVDGDAQAPENFSLATGNGKWVKSGDDGKVVELKPGNACSDDNKQKAELQVFKYTFNKADDTYSQEKLADPTTYVMRDVPLLGPPGDCVIVEYDTPKARTDKLCQQYGVKDAERCTSFGVKSYDPELCYIRQVTKGVQ